jgi:hypothetical protein
MIKKNGMRLAVLAGLAVAAIGGISTARAENPASFIHFAPEIEGYTATTATRFVSFVVRIPRNAFALRDVQIDVTNISLGTNFNMEMMVGCSNDTGVSGIKTGSWPLSSADDFTLQCPAFTRAVAVQGGLGISN